MKTMIMKRSTILIALACMAAVVAQVEDVCISQTNTFTARINIHAGELGYFTFDECPDLISPTIGMKIGETYTFSQAHRSNYYHPIGFAYFADGAHDDVDELEPGIAPYGTSSDCAQTLSCPAPMYFRNGTYLGTYSNNQEVLKVTTNEDDFGLDKYEPLFFRPMPEWAGFGNFEAKLLFDVTDFTRDIFYFCHIHQFMTGRIKLYLDDIKVQPDLDAPEIPYLYDIPSEFDQGCGTFGLDEFQLPHPQCPDRFVCNIPESNVALAQYSACTEAMNCHMLAGMTTNIKSQSEIALFIHQMVPHHQNAVNMAKSLLKTGKLQCDDLTDDESNDCILETMLWDMVNNQNFQIQAMHAIVEELGHPLEDDCVVLIESSSNATSKTVSTP